MRISTTLFISGCKSTVHVRQHATQVRVHDGIREAVPQPIHIDERPAVTKMDCAKGKRLGTDPHEKPSMEAKRLWPAVA